MSVYSSTTQFCRNHLKTSVLPTLFNLKLQFMKWSNLMPKILLSTRNISHTLAFFVISHLSLIYREGRLLVSWDTDQGWGQYCLRRLKFYWNEYLLPQLDWWLVLYTSNKPQNFLKKGKEKKQWKNKKHAGRGFIYQVWLIKSFIINI